MNTYIHKRIHAHALDAHQRRTFQVYIFFMLFSIHTVPHSIHIFCLLHYRPPLSRQETLWPLTLRTYIFLLIHLHHPPVNAAVFAKDART